VSGNLTCFGDEYVAKAETSLVARRKMTYTYFNGLNKFVIRDKDGIARFSVGGTAGTRLGGRISVCGSDGREVVSISRREESLSTIYEGFAQDQLLATMSENVSSGSMLGRSMRIAYRPSTNTAAPSELLEMVDCKRLGLSNEQRDGEMFVFQGSTAGECIAAMLNPNALDGNSDDATDLSDLQLSAAPSDNALLLHVVVPPGVDLALIVFIVVAFDEFSLRQTETN